MQQTLVIATNNQGKLKEIQNLLKDQQVEIKTLDSFDIDTDPMEIGEALEENARLKAQGVGDITQCFTLADDSGLLVDALDGAPGVYSKRFGNTTEERNQKLLESMREKQNRSARFEAVIAIYDPSTKETHTTIGIVEGEITHKPAGENGFGYDPVFYSTDLQKTFAQATQEEKQTVSHRARALEKALPLLKKLLA